MKKFFLILLLSIVLGCGKKLDLKPDSTLVIPTTVKDFENILDNTYIMNRSPGLAQISADEYYIPTIADFQSLYEPITRTAYIWQKDIYMGKTQLEDWTRPYAQIFYANSILSEIEKQDISNNDELKRIKGWALFVRAFCFYELTSIFSKAYNETTASTDLGIPLKLNPAITQIVPRSTVQQTYNQIITDAIEASKLLQTNIIQNKRNRPSKIAAYALLSRVYLSMRKYTEAEENTDKALALYSTLTDYKTLPLREYTSFDFNNSEVIYSSNMSDYAETSFASGSLYSVLPSIVNLFETNDLRRTVWFAQNTNGNWYIKGINYGFAYCFTGLATDELLLIKAECLARRNQSQDAMDQVNRLLITRWDAN
ncbi:MAG: hypothetical protein E2604_03965, partial [Flavobacterium sp.]|nr:hypothetical protein [Flavobacterium sp.]